MNSCENAKITKLSCGKKNNYLILHQEMVDAISAIEIYTKIIYSERIGNQDYRMGTTGKNLLLDAHIAIEVFAIKIFINNPSRGGNPGRK